MSVLPVLMSVLIVLELQFEKDRPENDGDCCRGENACYRGRDWSPVVRLHLFQKHAHLRKIFEGHPENMPKNSVTFFSDQWPAPAHPLLWQLWLSVCTRYHQIDHYKSRIPFLNISIHQTYLWGIQWQWQRNCWNLMPLSERSLLRGLCQIWVPGQHQVGYINFLLSFRDLDTTCTAGFY